MTDRITKSLRSAIARHFSVAVLFAAASLLPAHAQDGHWLTGYYAIYDQNGTMTPSQVDMTKLTHVIYWGVEPTSTGGLNTTKYVSASTFANGATSIVAAAHAAGAKALIGIGGDAYDGYSLAFNQATTPANLPTFVSSIVNLMGQYGFDGVDINWEQIGSYSGDNTQFPAFIKALRAQLNPLTPKPLLTMSPETEGNGGRPDLIGPIYQDFDQLNIQTYLMSGPYCGWETWHNSPMSNNGQNFVLDPSEPLPSITASVADYTSAGVPIAELGMGIQFGGLEWDGGAGTTTGGATKPLQTWTGDDNNAYCSETNPSAPTLGYPGYTSIAPLASGAPANGYTLNYDSVADQSWLSYDPSGTGTTNEANDKFITYDSPTSIAKKGTDLSSGTGLGGSMGGVMLFELSGDYFPSAATDQQHPLLNAANAMQSLLPGQIEALTITPGSGTAALSWTAAPFATEYQVYYSTSSTSAGTLNGTVSTTQSTVYGLNPGETYYFQVWPANAFGVATGGIVKGSATIGGSTAPTLTSPAPGSTLNGPSATFTWTSVTGSAGYWLFLGTTGVGSKNLYDSNQQAATSATFNNLPTDGVTIYARVYAKINGVLTYNDYTYTAAIQAPVLTSPAPNSTLTGTTATFTWTASGGQGYWLFVGTTGVGSKNIIDTGEQTATSATVGGLPSNGTKLYVRVYSRVNGTLYYNDYTYTSYMEPPVLTSPTPGSTLGGASETFTWSAASSGNQGYWLFLGTTGVGSKNLYDSGQQTATSATFSGLPTNGVTIYARVYTRYNGVLVYNDYTYKAQ